MSNYASQHEYIEALKSVSALPEGFQVSTHQIEFSPTEKPASAPYRMNLCLILLDRETASFGAVFTNNAFPGAPIVIGMKRLERRTVGGILINNRIANVSAPGGVEDAEGILECLAQHTNRSPDSYFIASTGIIGWKLPVDQIGPALPGLVASLGRDSLLPAAEAIMTTDAYPKVRAAKLGSGRIVGIAKGAGMIEPNMGTLLVFLLTDVSVPREALREQLAACVDKSFNRISIDSDQSTSDMVILASSHAREAVSAQDFGQALQRVCLQLAEDVVRNGEGVEHVVRVCVQGCSDEELALGAAKAIVNSPLVKTAVFGNDPNVGRILSALGDYLGTRGVGVQAKKLRMTMGGIEVFCGGSFRLSAAKEEKLCQYLQECSLDANLKQYPQHERAIQISVDLGQGKAAAAAIGADLSHAYVTENAEYRT